MYSVYLSITPQQSQKNQEMLAVVYCILGIYQMSIFYVLFKLFHDLYHILCNIAKFFPFSLNNNLHIFYSVEIYLFKFFKNVNT